MSLTTQKAREIAHLARLELTDEEIELYREQLSAVLDYVAQISQLDLTDVPATTHAISQQNIFRQDVAEPPMPVEDALFNAPQQQDNQFKIQAILEEEITDDGR